MSFVITDMNEALKKHKLSSQDYDEIFKILGREPNLVELGVFSAMWSEHCSYKSSRIYLKGFPVSAPWVIQGPGENAGVIDISGGYAAVFKVESHNHPSFIEPHAGAATGVGGIMRDIFTMGARPVASLDSIRFGEIWRDDAIGKKHKYLLRGVVEGIGSYGNCMGVPTIGGESSFEQCYNGNILVNAFCLGIAKSDEIFYGRADGVGNLVIYVGSKTGRDGLGGAVMSSDSFTQDSKALRPTVQVGDPFTEKLLLEACLELFHQNLIVGIQDMGAAGLTSSSFEMADRSGSGMKLYLDKVPMRESGMNAYELMLSESQERMLICAKRESYEEIKKIFDKWELNCAVIGEVSDSGAMELYWEEERVGFIPIKPIVANAPVLNRPTKKPAYLDSVSKQHYTQSPLSQQEMFKKLLGSIDICDKEWIYSQYDSSVQTNTIIESGQGDASAIRVKENGVALAMSIYSPIRYCYLNPQEGAKIAVATAGRKCITRGARPLAISDCLNFGSPENPEVMWQFKEVCEGIKLASKALDMPVVSGNVSLYNQTEGIDIYPTPTIAAVGINNDATKIIDSAFKVAGNCVVLLGRIDDGLDGSVLQKVLYGINGGNVPAIDLEAELRLWNLTLEAIEKNIIISSKEVGNGGLAITLAKMALFGNIGIRAKNLRVAIAPLTPSQTQKNLESKTPESKEYIFAQSQSCIVAEVAKDNCESLKTMAKDVGIPFAILGEIGGDRLCIDEIDLSLAELREIFYTSFSHYIH
ncbi:phosphoribosylformylglycinamidine synthase subunit PurL [uncultured Helicobacter sp.]|uniref:phosphoribosylformylglycinamidine synthase subunit PurL n=1 Tax=uncultured Helicobacter sp. TaxID=175537 RepID=UPI0027DE43BB|nr:phosphoribosylformylglycinamidine synthase subunit PurL [uncultured Helicobacter sp.]